MVYQYKILYSLDLFYVVTHEKHETLEGYTFKLVTKDAVSLAISMLPRMLSLLDRVAQQCATSNNASRAQISKDYFYILPVYFSTYSIGIETERWMG